MFLLRNVNLLPRLAFHGALSHEPETDYRKSWTLSIVAPFGGPGRHSRAAEGRRRGRRWKGHWITGTAMIIACYAFSLLVIERLFVIVKPKLLTIPWFAKLWEAFVFARTRAWRIIKTTIVHRSNRKPIASSSWKCEAPPAPGQGTLGSTAQNEHAQQQDLSNVKGLPGYTSGPPLRR